MTNFLFESTISLIGFLAFYHLFLEGEKMHRFNRFYLLISLVVSFITPFISIELIQEVKNFSLIENNLLILANENPVPAIASTNYISVVLFSLYALIALILSVRFFKNIYYFKQTIKANQKVKFKNATLVLLEQKTIPHTFLNYIFLNKAAYDNSHIEEELYAHELTHVNQKHSYDILCIEVLKIIFWFNPLFYFYKKAIQLNHEFLADESVVKTYTNVSFYQSLLLNTNENTTYYLASNLNYLITKKRLIMMTKTTSTFSVFIKKAGIIPLMTLMIYFLCTDLVAQEKKKSNTEKPTLEQTTDDFPYKELDAYYGKTRVIVKNKEGKIILDKPYNELSLVDKKRVPPPPPPPPKKVKMTEEQFIAYHNKSSYAIWIDGKHVENSELKNYKSSDFALHLNSRVTKKARSKKFPQNYLSLIHI